MAKFEAVNVAKFKDAGSVAGILMHDNRDRHPDNADKERTHENICLEGGLTLGEDMGKWRSLVPEKRRKDAVTLASIVVQVSPEKLQEMQKTGKVDQYYKEVFHWLKQRYGQHDNVIRCDVHKDEKSAHLHFCFVPLVKTQDGLKLSYKEVLGRPRNLKMLHTEMHREVGKKYGLDRAIEGSRAKHKTIQEFFKDLEKNKKHLQADIVIENTIRDRVQEMKGKLEVYFEKREKEIEEEKEKIKAPLARLQAEKKQVSEVAVAWKKEYDSLVKTILHGSDKEWEATVNRLREREEKQKDQGMER